MKTPSLFSILAILSVLSLGTACSRREKQHVIENRIAHEIIALIKWYQWEHPGQAITNLSQIFVKLETKYPYAWHDKFGRFGKNAGFKNSIFEKYVFLPSGITNRFVEGEILVVNAKPFPGSEGEDGRIIISRVGIGAGDYRRWWYPESQIQKIFAEAGIVIPKPASMPPPPPPPEPSETDKLFEPNVWSRTADFFDRIAGALHLGEKGGRILQWWTITLAPVFSSMVVLWAIYRFFKRRKHG